jgi:hypothetical protein
MDGRDASPIPAPQALSLGETNLSQGRREDELGPQ